MNKQLTESPANDRILSQMLALEVQDARRQRYPSAEEIVEEVSRRR